MLFYLLKCMRALFIKKLNCFETIIIYSFNQCRIMNYNLYYVK
jgi:hypothetical protein